MLAFIVLIILAILFLRLLGFLFQGVGGILLIILGLIFFPIITIFLLASGFAVFAIPILILGGIATLAYNSGTAV